jgi:hypothetical protein
VTGNPLLGKIHIELVAVRGLDKQSIDLSLVIVRMQARQAWLCQAEMPVIVDVDGGNKMKQEQVDGMPPEAAAFACEGLSKTFWWGCWVWWLRKRLAGNVDETQRKKIKEEESNSQSRLE